MWPLFPVTSLTGGPVRVREVTGDERDRRYDEQARRYPGFAEYAQKTAGIRTIPVLELSRVPAA